MTAPPTLAGANANLIETYFRLARATPGSTFWDRGHLQGCFGVFNHPICNFVVASGLDETEAQELRRITESRDTLHIYVPPGPAQKRDEALLVATGLQPIYRLKQMHAEPIFELPGVQPVEATTHAARLALARFMVGQFFSTQPKLFREGIARATARAGGLDLYAIGYQGQIIGGVMLCREGNTLGVYNLCVTPGSQNQGWGRSIVNWARTCAGVEGRSVTLQCDERLVNWYTKSGFSQTGEIVAYSRINRELFDTM